MKQRKAKNGKGNHDKDTGMFAFTSLTIISFPATHDSTWLAQQGRETNSDWQSSVSPLSHPRFTCKHLKYMILLKVVSGKFNRGLLRSMINKPIK